MKAKLLLIDNYDSFTYNLVQAFLVLGADVLVHRNDRIGLDEAEALAPTHLCISPGPGTPDEAGVSSLSTIEQCIDDVQFKSWVQDATNRALTQPIPNTDPELPSVTGTPTVLVNGQQYGGSLDDPQEFQAFVLQAASATFNDSDSTPTPTPTPTPAQ